MLSGGATPEQFCSDVAQLLGAEHVTLCLVRHKRLQLVPAFSTEPARLTDDACHSPSESLRKALEANAPHRIDHNGRTMLFHPVSFNGEALGLIEALSILGSAFTDSDAALLAHVAPLATPPLRERWQQVFEGTHGLSPSCRRSSHSNSPALPRGVPSILRANSADSNASGASAGATGEATVSAGEDGVVAAADAPSSQGMLELVSDLTRLSGSNEQMIRQIRAAAKEAVTIASPRGHRRDACDSSSFPHSQPTILIRELTDRARDAT